MAGTRRPRAPFRAPLATLVVLFAVGAWAGPDFWPAGQPLQRDGFDFWRVWRTRTDMRKAPTTAFNLLERQADLGMWIAELRRRGVALDATVPATRIAGVATLIKAGDTDGACRHLDGIFRALEALEPGAGANATWGSITGQVIDEEGLPIAGADVIAFGTPLGAVTDAQGKFCITDVPVRAPRYVVRAHRPGYLEGFTGGLTPLAEDSGAVILMEKVGPETSFREDVLAVKACCVTEVTEKAAAPTPFESAVVDARIYPTQVLPYLESAESIDSESAEVQGVAQSILATVPEPDRLRATILAKAVFAWLVQNVAYDDERFFPDDPTCGNWQRARGAWGREMQDWLQKPSQVLATRRANVAEYDRLAVALLRALGIPARPALLDTHSVCQWWVQLATGNGYWANMETFRGRLSFLQRGEVSPQLPAVGDDQIVCFPLAGEAIPRASWDAVRPCMWIEDCGERATVGAGPKGLKQTEKLVELFLRDGRIPGGSTRGVTPDLVAVQKGYIISSYGITLDLATIGAQRRLSVKFPMQADSQFRRGVDIKHWTNHPEWAKQTRREKQVDERTKQMLNWYVVDFEIDPAAKPAEAPAATG